MPSVSEYVELRCRSAFSFLDGASLPENLAEAAAAAELDTLTDGPPLLLLVENQAGYKNLCRLLTRAREGLCKADPPRATPELLAEHAAGLIALGGAAPRADLPALCA